MKKLLLIVNPIAGQKRAARRLPEIRRVFADCGYESTVYYTSYAGDAREKMKTAAGFDRIVIAGGDGTLRESVTGLCEAGLTVPVGYIPCGSTNDFGTSLGLSKDLLRAARDAAALTPVPTDLGSFCGSTFGYVASFGAFTPASYSAPTRLKNAVGHFAYILEAVKQLPTLRPYHLRVETAEGSCEGEFLLGAVANSTSMAGVLRLDKSLVRFDDGLFEILLVEYPRSFRAWCATVRGLLTKRYDGKRIRFFSTASVTIIADPSMPWSLDGEKHEGIARGEARVLPGAVRMARPR